MNTQQLLIVMQEWIASGQRLYALLDRQSKALAHRDVTQVEALRTHIEQSLETAQALDARRSELFNSLAQELEVGVNLKEISSKLPANEARAVTHISLRAGRLAEAIRLMLERNRVLIENELVYVEGTLSLIAKAAQEQTAYGRGNAPALWVNEVA